jgi:hypothetical protein
VKAYLAVTAALFGILTAVHVWRAIVESSRLATDPWFLLVTAISALMCAWACRLLFAAPSRDGV